MYNETGFCAKVISDPKMAFWPLPTLRGYAFPRDFVSHYLRGGGSFTAAFKATKKYLDELYTRQSLIMLKVMLANITHVMNIKNTLFRFYSGLAPKLLCLSCMMYAAICRQTLVLLYCKCIVYLLQYHQTGLQLFG